MEQKDILAQMDKAPMIKATSLSGDYRLLGEFNNIVLAGHWTRFNLEFVTWEWVQDHTTLWQGHYYGDDLDSAQRDFVTRSGLVPESRLFTDKQLAVIFDACQSAQVYNAPENAEHERLLESVMDQIGTALPEVVDLANELTQTPKKADVPSFQGNQGMEMGGF